VRKTFWIISLLIVVVGLVFGFGYMQGRRAGTGIMDTIVGGYRSDIEQLERDIAEARRIGDIVRDGIGNAQESIDNGAGRLEESLGSIAKLGSVTAQIRGLAGAIREHIDYLRQTAEVLENIRNDLDSSSGAFGGS